MELPINENPEFTEWLVREGVLVEPFVLIDVGVQDGEDGRWRVLGDHLVVHGFDPIAEVVEALSTLNHGKVHRHYHWMALGNMDGEGSFYFNPAKPTESSMYRKEVGPCGIEIVQELRKVPIRRLDSLLAEGLVPQADFMKIDVEGFEQDVLLGSREFLRGGVLGLQTETNFGLSPPYPKSHFVTMAEIALEHHLVVFDLAFNRIPRASFQRALVRKGFTPIAEHDAVGRPATVNVLFARDLIEEADRPSHYPHPCRAVSANQLIKSMIICELHALNDVALDIAEHFADRLGAHLDVERAVRLLADPDCLTNQYHTGYRRQLRAQQRAYEESTSWRITAPLRWTKLLFGAPRAVLGEYGARARSRGRSVT
jgi:FkbM family methyltransferase